MFNHIYDAVRIVEAESRSALPDAPVREYRENSGLNWRFSARLALSSQLHRLAAALEPNRELLEPRLSPDPCTGC
jgi:hypothetical protein